jgi:hypothetical protein
MIDRVSEIRSRWQRVEAERRPQKRKNRSCFPFPFESESAREPAPDNREPENRPHVNVRI